MKTGLSLTELARKIEGNRELKHDLIASTSDCCVAIESDGVPMLQVGLDAGSPQFGILPGAHDQIAARIGIPAKYYDRMRKDAPDLLASNVNHWFFNSPEKRMIRTLGGDARAFLSNRYQRIENEEIAEVALPILADIPDVKIVSSEITDRRMYIQAVAPRIEGEIKVGDTVQAGVIISNSETGHGSVSIKPFIYRLVCLNGAVINASKFLARHVGARIDNSEALWSDEARRADDRAILLKVRDVVRAAVDANFFAETIERMRGLTEISVKGDPAKAVEVLARKVGATETERGGILRSLIEGGDLSAWGLLNAVTHQAHTARDYDRSVEFEQMGGNLIDLSRSEWNEILIAA